MKKQTHTPGPWFLHIGLDYFEIDNSAGSMVLSEVPCNPDSELEVADARLIAAAPELLEALEEARKRLAELAVITKRDSIRTLEIVDAAIRKAKR